MSTPIQLYALAWTQQDRLTIENWSQQFADNVTIVGWSRILLEPLHVAAQDPNIMGLAIDGVVIVDHTSHPPDNLKVAVQKLNASTLKLYSVKNGRDPVTVSGQA